MRLLHFLVCALVCVPAMAQTPAPAETKLTEAAVIKRIEDLGGSIEQHKTRAGHPVVAIDLHGTDAVDEDLIKLRVFPDLENLRIDATKITENGLVHLKSLEHLRTLHVDEGLISATGLAQLSELPALKVIQSTHVLRFGRFSLAYHDWKTVCVELLIFVLLIGPAVVYMFNGYKDRKDELLSLLDGNARKLYLDYFTGGTNEEADVGVQFDRYYSRRFGSLSFVVPMVAYAAVLICAVVWCGSHVTEWLNSSNATSHALALFALAGGMTWVLFDQLEKTQSRRFLPADVHWMTFRLLIAVPMAYALSSLANEAVSPAVAYILGTFPTQTLMTIARRAGMAALKMTSIDVEGKAEGKLLDLQGIDRGNAERLADDGINTVIELAYCDPISVSVRTGLDIICVLDIASQALLWMYLEEGLATSRKFGLRGASEVIWLYDELQSEDLGIKQEATNKMEALATALGVPALGLKNCLLQVAEDPYAQFIQKVWGTRSWANRAPGT